MTKQELEQEIRELAPVIYAGRCKLTNNFASKGIYLLRQFKLQFKEYEAIGESKCELSAAFRLMTNYFDLLAKAQNGAS